jgi:hypothetical protein
MCLPQVIQYVDCRQVDFKITSKWDSVGLYILLVFVEPWHEMR